MGKWHSPTKTKYIVSAGKSVSRDVFETKSEQLALEVAALIMKHEKENENYMYRATVNKIEETKEGDDATMTSVLHTKRTLVAQFGPIGVR